MTSLDTAAYRLFAVVSSIRCSAVVFCAGFCSSRHLRASTPIQTVGTCRTQRCSQSSCGRPLRWLRRPGLLSRGAVVLDWVDRPASCCRAPWRRSMARIGGMYRKRCFGKSLRLQSNSSASSSTAIGNQGASNSVPKFAGVGARLGCSTRMHRRCCSALHVQAQKIEL